MTLSELQTEFRLQVPMATDAGISDSVLTPLFNRGVEEVNLRALVYFGYAEFSATINKRIYNISEISELDDYLGMGAGIFFFKNSSNKYVEIYPKTKEWFEENLQDWRTASSGDPQYYCVDGDRLFFDKPFSSARTLRLEDYLKKPNAMGNGNHYPWTGTTTEIGAFRALDLAILTYAKWRVQPVLGKDEQGNYRGGSTYAEFIEEVRSGGNRVRRRPDLGYLNINRMTVA